MVAGPGRRRLRDHQPTLGPTGRPRDLSRGYWITSVAWITTDRGMVSPSVWAVLRLITKSNVVPALALPDQAADALTGLRVAQLLVGHAVHAPTVLRTPLHDLVLGLATHHLVTIEQADFATRERLRHGVLLRGQHPTTPLYGGAVPFGKGLPSPSPIPAVRRPLGSVVA